jgi:hypothetical protein
MMRIAQGPEEGPDVLEAELDAEALEGLQVVLGLSIVH